MSGSEHKRENKFLKEGGCMKGDCIDDGKDHFTALPFKAHDTGYDNCNVQARPVSYNQALSECGEKYIKIHNLCHALDF